MLTCCAIVGNERGSAGISCDLLAMSPVPVHVSMPVSVPVSVPVPVLVHVSVPVVEHVHVPVHVHDVPVQVAIPLCSVTASFGVGAHVCAFCCVPPLALGVEAGTEVSVLAAASALWLLMLPIAAARSNAIFISEPGALRRELANKSRNISSANF